MPLIGQAVRLLGAYCRTIDQFGSSVNVQLTADSFPVVTDSLGAQVQSGRNFLAGFSFSDKGEDLLLPRR
jgi:hypothetical protein